MHDEFRICSCFASIGSICFGVHRLCPGRFKFWPAVNFKNSSRLLAFGAAVIHDAQALMFDVRKFSEGRALIRLKSQMTTPVSEF